MSWEADFRDNVRSAVVAAWPELVAVVRENRATRVNWRELIERYDYAAREGEPTAGLFRTPFAVIEIGGFERTDDGGDAHPGYNCAVSVFYITRREQDDGTMRTTEELEVLLAEKCALLVTEFERDTWDMFQSQMGCNTSQSASLPPNDYFVRSQLPLYAALVGSTLLTGPPHDP